MLTLNIRGATVSIPEAEIERLWLASVREEAPAARIKLPRIGSPWSGGIYAGIVRGDAGQRDYHLIASNDEIVRAVWGAAMVWASNLTPHSGRSWKLPARRDQVILNGNLPELFAAEWYWSSEEYVPYEAYAWAHHFGAGSQHGHHRGTWCRARAVLHIPVGEG